MRIYAHRPVGLHSESKGLIQIPAKTTANVPDDVMNHGVKKDKKTKLNHNQIDNLVEGGYITLLKDRKNGPAELEEKKSDIPFDEEPLEADEEDVVDEENDETDEEDADEEESK